ncbi:MAG: hypothetical protein JST19_01395 [Bacteroidetes bacterium]|nr:hypothetical protein [Bacteroidota bacterium]
MKTVYSLLFVTLFSLPVLRSAAQNKIADTDLMMLPGVHSTTFNATAVYMSNLSYDGRRDATNVPVLMPGATAVFKHGLFVSAIGYWDVNGAKSGAEGLSITPGYMFSLDTGRKFGGNITATKYFITNNSPIILSSFNVLLDGQLYYNGPVKTTVGITYSFDKGSNRDIINTFQVEKDLWLLKTGLLKLNGLKITPAITAYAGSQSFTETYYVNSQVPRALTDPALVSPITRLFPGLSQQQILTKTVTRQKTQEVKQYNLLAVSASLPIGYTLNSWQFTFTPYLTRPFNQVDYSGGGISGSYFFYTIGVSYIF